MANQVLTYNPASRATSPLAGSVSDYYRKKMAGGGITDATRAKWAEMDDATGAAAAQTRMNQAQPGMFGQGRASRAMGATDQTIMAQVAANKLKQAQMAGDEQDKSVAGASAWQQLQDSNARADRAQALQTAEALGDTVTMAGMNRQALEQQGYGYTDYGQRQLDDQSAQAKADAEWAKTQQQEAWDMSKRSNQQAMDIAQEESDNNLMNIVGGVTRKVSKTLGRWFG